MIKIILILYAIWNVLVFLLYGLDKLKAKRQSRRISEKALLLCALFMGSVGAFVGMQLFRHKTKHTSFNILVPLFLIINLAVLFFLGKKLI